MAESYEQLRDSSSGQIGDAWKRADRMESELRGYYRQLKEDPRYTEEHKAVQAWQRYDRDAEKITTARERSRNLLEDSARAYQRQSLPFPDGQGAITTDNDRIIMTQNEASRIVRKVDRLVSSARGPMKPDRVGILRSEYEKGLEIGGPMGGAICRAVISAADEYGVDEDSIVDSFRSERHKGLVESAQRNAIMLQSIGKAIPEPPFKRPGTVTLRNFSLPRASAAGVRGETWHDPTAPNEGKPAAVHEPDQEGGTVTVIGGRSTASGPYHIERDTIEIRAGGQKNRKSTSEKPDKGKKDS